MLVGDPKEARNRKEQKTLRPGAYFGEISLVYGCKTTARVTAQKYCTLAHLSCDEFQKITTQIPKLLESLTLGIYGYEDRKLRFIKRSISKVPYF